MIRLICKLPLVACLLVLFITPAHADVSHEGLYITVAIILGILFLPVIVVAISHRTRKKLYLIMLILWGMAAFLYLWFTGGRQNEFFIISSVPYLILLVYLFKEKKLDKAKET